MMINVAAAFENGCKGFSIWRENAERLQASIKRRDGSFAIGYGSTPEEAFSAAVRAKEGWKPKRLRRDTEDLA